MGSNLFSPDNFKGDWYGWLTNQVSHTFLGIFLVFFASMAGFSALGEFPVKLNMLIAIGAVYILFVELYLQGWRGFDTIEDSMFVVGYGAAGPLAASFELLPGKAAIIMDLDPLVPFFYVFIAHIIAGVAWRKFDSRWSA